MTTLSKRRRLGDVDVDCDHERHAHGLASGVVHPSAKRRRTGDHRDRDIISTLSDELLVRILSFLDERTLLRISQVSRRLNRVTSDSQLWRPHYYRRFILPRAHRIPGFRTGSNRNSSKLQYSTQKSIWADGGWGRRGGFVGGVQEHSGPSNTADTVDWKKQYRLRHNWARGRCAVDEVQVREVERHSPSAEWQTLVKVVEGLAVTVDGMSGLRAWDLKTRRLLTHADLEITKDTNQPSCLAVDDLDSGNGVLSIAVGFEDGTFAIWKLDVQKKKLMSLYRHSKSYFGELVAIAYGYPYVLTASRLGFISLFSFDQAEVSLPSPQAETATEAGDLAAFGISTFSPAENNMRSNTRDFEELAFSQPHLLTSLKSHSTRPPLALSIRRTPASVVASIAYSFDAVGGWSIGIQDLDIKPSGLSKPDVVTSRVAYTLPTQTRKSTTSSPSSSPSGPTLRNPIQLLEPEEDGPIRLCYSHPYLLATLPDNTLVLHLCTSTASALSISSGIRLWGHTSGISDAEITPRGKAVSVSTRGDEIRVWELEGRVGGRSVEVRPRTPNSDDESEGDVSAGKPETPVKLSDLEDRKNWVGFDDEMVVVLKEARDGRESLMVYDFT